MSDFNFNMAPINPMAGVMDSLKLGTTLGGIRDQRADAQAQAEAARIAAEEKKIKDAQVAAAYEETQLNPSGATFEKLASLQDPAMAESTRKNWAMRSEAQNDITRRDMGKVYALVHTGDIEGAKRELQLAADAHRNSNNPGSKQALADTQRFYTMLAEGGDQGREIVEETFGLMLATVPGGKDAIDAIVNFGKERRDDVAALALKNSLPKGPPISASAEKLVNDSVISAVKANALTGQYATLAGDFEKIINTAGVGAKLGELISRTLGTEKEPTALRQEFLRMRNTAVLDMLPPGVASDKDIEVAMASFPTETSSPDNIARFLRGMSKLKAYEAAVESAKAEWIQQNGTLGTANSTMQVGNREVKPNARFSEFIKVYIPNTSVLGSGGAAGASFGTPSEATPAAPPASGSMSLRDFIKKEWPDEVAKIDKLTDAQLEAEYKKTTTKYKVGQANTEPIIEGGF
jgi:hypothetical protein